MLQLSDALALPDAAERLAALTELHAALTVELVEVRISAMLTKAEIAGKVTTPVVTFVAG